MIFLLKYVLGDFYLWRFWTVLVIWRAAAGRRRESKSQKNCQRGLLNLFP